MLALLRAPWAPSTKAALLTGWRVCLLRSLWIPCPCPLPTCGYIQGVQMRPMASQVAGHGLSAGGGAESWEDRSRERRPPAVLWEGWEGAARGCSGGQRGGDVCLSPGPRPSAGSQERLQSPTTQSAPRVLENWPAAPIAPHAGRVGKEISGVQKVNGHDCERGVQEASACSEGGGFSQERAHTLGTKDPTRALAPAASSPGRPPSCRRVTGA